MKLIIFGTGNYCLKYLKYIDEDKILFLIDNNPAKCGKRLNKKIIYPINKIHGVDYDYVIVLIKKYAFIVEQLLKEGIHVKKIITYDKLDEVIFIPQKVHAKNGEQSILEWAENRIGKKIFICSHNFSRTGVPVALMHLAVLLRQMNYHVLMAAEREGALINELCKREIDYISNLGDIYFYNDFLEQMKRFDVVILGTLVLNEIGSFFSMLNIPIFWWIHESMDDLYQAYQLPENRGNIHYYGGGKRALRKFSEYYPNESIKELLYYLPDSQSLPHIYTETRTFSLIGAWSKRKAQDILLSAIEELPKHVRKKCVFYFVGTTLEEERKIIDDICMEFAEVRYISELSQEELAECYKQIDVLICPSRDDPMPIVVTQALQNGIPCIISNKVGQCEYFYDMEGGVIFPSENISALKQWIIEFATCPKSKMEEYSQNARKIFELHFSEISMKENMEKILNDILIV